jgi:hypothetical protein
MKKNKELEELESMDFVPPTQAWQIYVYTLRKVLDANIHRSVSKSLEWDTNRQLFTFTLTERGGELGSITQQFTLKSNNSRDARDEIKRLQKEIMTWRVACAEVSCPKGKELQWAEIAMWGSLEDFGMKRNSENLSSFPEWDLVKGRWA